MTLVRPPAIVLCPPLGPDPSPPDWHEPLAGRLAELDVPVLAPAVAPGASLAPADPGTPEDRLAIAGWVADQAVAITAARLDRPLVLVATGDATRGLPALALSQRASRHAVVGYVLVDGPLPRSGPATAEWPDAPVLVVLGRRFGQQVQSAALLRGWTVLGGDPVAAVVALANTWPDLPR